MTNSTNLKIAAGLAIAATITLGAAGLISGKSDNPAATAAAQLPPATVATPVVDTIAISEEYPAEIEPIERVELRPRVAGQIASVHFREGEDVSRGQLLFRIDSRPYEATLAQAKAMLAQAEADAATAEREEERGARLVEKRAITEEQNERRSANASAARARVDAAKAAVERALLDLSWTEVRAPIAGRIGRAEVTTGNLVGPESRLGVIVSVDELYVRFDVDENRLASATTAAKEWKVGFALAGDTSPRAAVVSFIDNEIGRGTGTLRVRATVSNGDRRLIPGMFGKATVTFAEQSRALLVREEAIAADQGKRFVLVADAKGVLQYRPVTLGARHGELRVITSGLEKDDRVVVSGLFRLRPGATVLPNVVPMQSNEKES